MSDEYSSEVDLSQIDHIIYETVDKVCDELSYSKDLYWGAGFNSLMNRINELHKMSIKGN